MTFKQLYDLAKEDPKAYSNTPGVYLGLYPRLDGDNESDAIYAGKTFVVQSRLEEHILETTRPETTKKGRTHYGIAARAKGKVRYLLIVDFRQLNRDSATDHVLRVTEQAMVMLLDSYIDLQPIVSGAVKTNAFMRSKCIVSNMLRELCEPGLANAGWPLSFPWSGANVSSPIAETSTSHYGFWTRWDAGDRYIVVKQFPVIVHKQGASHWVMPFGTSGTMSHLMFACKNPPPQVRNGMSVYVVFEVMKDGVHSQRWCRESIYGAYEDWTKLLSFGESWTCPIDVTALTIAACQWVWKDAQDMWWGMYVQSAMCGMRAAAAKYFEGPGQEYAATDLVASMYTYNSLMRLEYLRDPAQTHPKYRKDGKRNMIVKHLDYNHLDRTITTTIVPTTKIPIPRVRTRTEMDTIMSNDFPNPPTVIGSKPIDRKRGKGGGSGAGASSCDKCRIVSITLKNM